MKKLEPDQVEMLLTGGEIKTWIQTDLVVDGERRVVQSCSDSVLWVFEVISDDSTASYKLTFDNQCLFYDTAFFGAFSASSYEEVFTDSLKFEGGSKTFMLPRFIRSDIFSVTYTENGQEIISTFEATRSEYLPRQVAAILSGGATSGDFASWYLTSLTIDGSRSQLVNCSDSTIFKFSRSGADGLISLDELEATDTTCMSYSTAFIGEVSVPGDDQGFFNYLLQVDEGDISDMIITSFDQTSFEAQYERSDSTHVATYERLD
ncbi:MAG: hypothetical protein ABJH57_21495 [Cyclobacteriaceae bacterium]